MLEVAICDDDKEDLDKAALMLDKILQNIRFNIRFGHFYRRMSC